MTTTYYEGVSINGSGRGHWLDVIQTVNEQEGMAGKQRPFAEPVIVQATPFTPYTEVYEATGRVASFIVTFTPEQVDGKDGQRVRIIAMTEEAAAALTSAVRALALPLQTAPQKTGAN